MLNYWKQNPMPQEEFIIERTGSEVKNALKTIRSNPNNRPTKNCIHKNADEIGKFRLSGEIHQWMYDEYSLGKLLQIAEFNQIKKVEANKSYIKNFNSYFLDIEQNGEIRKPDSLFMEAIK